MKVFNKSEIEYKNGYLMHDGEIVCIDNEIVDLANKIEDDYQKAMYEKTQPKIDLSDLIEDKFVRKSEYKKPIITASTPELDDMVDRAIKLMGDLDKVSVADAVNDYFDGISPIIRFVQDDFVISQEHQGAQHRFDLPMLGNPCEWTPDSLALTVTEMFDDCDE